MCFHDAKRFLGGLAGPRPGSPRRGRRGAFRHRERSLEQLEPRFCFSADLGTRLVEWSGRVAEAYVDSWIAKATSAKCDSLSLGSGWSSESLGEGFWRLSTPGASQQQVVQWGAASPWIDYVEPDFAIAPQAIPNDSSFGQLWGLHNVGQSGGVVDADIDAPAAWDVSTGSRSVVVAVIDTGIDYTHPDLAANVWTNPGEIAGDGIDNDRNGYIDDVHGWDFANNDSNPMDDNGHGTHVSGTIGAVGNNARGVAGVAWEVSIMGLKFLSGAGSGSTSGAVAAINYATRMRRDFGVNIVATNNSWGGGGFSTSLRDAIEAGGRAGILFVAAAGNESNDNDASPSYPASYTSSSIISVAATDRSNRMASFSNYGVSSVDLAAPGVSIYSTTPGNTYASYSGTSMATPHVTGAVALLAAAAPTASASQIRDAILSSTSPVAALAGKVATGGLLNVAAALDVLVGDVPPRADIVDVAPDTRYDGVESIRITFNRAVSGFDLGDLSLTRDGQSVGLDGASLTADAGTGTWTLSGLSTATSAIGVYTLRLTAAGSGIVDSSGVALAADAADSWQVIAPPPPAPDEPNDSIAEALPIALSGGRATVSGIVGDGAHGLADVDLIAVQLLAGSVFTVDIDAASLPTPSSLDAYVRVFDANGRMVAFNDDRDGSLDSFLSMPVVASGTYYVGISSYGNAAYDPLVAGSGQNGVSGGGYEVILTSVLPPLTVDIVDVTPDPRTTGVDSILIGFNRRVTGFDLSDLVLTRDGTAVALDTATLAPVADSIWSLGSLENLTAVPGRYALTLDASRSGIVDDHANALVGSATDTWTVVRPIAVADAGDAMQNAYRLDAARVATSGVTLAGRIGDGRYGTRDVDLYRITMQRGQRLVIDVDAAAPPLRSSLDSVLRLFDAQGRQIAVNDDFNGSLDSLISFTAQATSGVYYIGVSGYGNMRYDARKAGSGRAGSRGEYQISFSMTSPSRTGQSVTVMGFADQPTASNQRQRAFAALSGGWLGADWLPMAERRTRPR